MPSSSGSPEPPVSARSETLEGIDPEQRAWLASYLDVFAKKYARELAEKLRDRHSGTCGCGCDCAGFIDPEVIE